MFQRTSSRTKRALSRFRKVWNSIIYAVKHCVLIRIISNRLPMRKMFGEEISERLVASKHTATADIPYRALTSKSTTLVVASVSDAKRYNNVNFGEDEDKDPESLTSTVSTGIQCSGCACSSIATGNDGVSNVSVEHSETTGGGSDSEDSRRVNKDICHYCVVRADIPYGLAAAMLIHAAGESSDRVPSGTIAVALTAESELELLGLARKLTELGVAHVTIHEGEGPYEGQAMAIGIEPTVERLRIRKVTSHLPCVK